MEATPITIFVLVANALCWITVTFLLTRGFYLNKIDAQRVTDYRRGYVNGKEEELLQAKRRKQLNLMAEYENQCG